MGGLTRGEGVAGDGDRDPDEFLKLEVGFGQ